MAATPDYRWTNWNRNLSCTADLYRPGGLDELCAEVRTAAARGRVRAVGNSCSWSPLVPLKSGGSLIDLSRLTRVLTLDTESATPTLTVEAGVSMRELVSFTRAHGLSIITPTIFQGVSMGGAIGVGAHGTGLHSATISDDVVALTIVDSSGTPHHIEQRHGDVLEAARVALGTLGVIYSAKLRLHRAYNVHVEDRFISRGEVLSGLPDLLASYDFVELFWFPFSDTMWCKLMNRTTQPAEHGTLRGLAEGVLDYAATMFAGAKLLPPLSRYLPGLTPALMRLSPLLAVREGVRVLPASTEFHYQKAYPRNWDMSWAVPLDDATQAWRAAIELVESFARRAPPLYPVNMVLHSRFIGASTALLSPAYGRPICDLEAVTCTGTPGHEPFYHAFTDAMLAFPSSRPHWGKYILRPRELKARYPKMERFLELRRQFDPDGVFLNDFLEDDVFQLRG